MAHMLETLNGKVSMAYAGETPWHGLGTKVLPDLTPAQMLEAAGLNWRVEKIPLFGEMNGVQIPTRAEALVRDVDQKVLSIVTDSWNPVQNEEAFDFFAEFVNAGDMEMHTAGSIRGGQHIWALAKIKDSFFDLFGGDKTEGYLLFSNPHQFGKSIMVQFTPIRVVCNNTLTFSLERESKNQVTVNHRREFDADRVKEMMGIATFKLEKYKEMAQFLGSKKASTENVVEYFNRVFPMTTGAKKDEGKLASRAARQAFDLVEVQPGAEFAKGTWWQAFNAVTFLTDHEAGRSTDTRLASAWFGANKDRKVKALNLAVEMAEAA